MMQLWKIPPYSFIDTFLKRCPSGIGDEIQISHFLGDSSAPNPYQVWFTNIKNFLAYVHLSQNKYC